MALPKIDIPVYDTTLPLTGLKVKFRPIRVREEKIILMATQADDPKEVQSAIEQILNNCIVSGVEKVKSLPIADVEWLIIRIRDKSLGGKQQLSYTCGNVVEEKACGNRFKLDIDFAKLQIIKPEKAVSDKIQLSETVGVKLRPPSFDVLRNYQDSTSYDYDIFADVIECVYDKEQTYDLRESSKKEIEEFFDSWAEKDIEAIYAYIASMPRYEIDVKHKCEKCGFEHEIKVTDLASFFQ